MMEPGQTQTIELSEFHALILTGEPSFIWPEITGDMIFWPQILMEEGHLGPR